MFRLQVDAAAELNVEVLEGQCKQISPLQLRQARLGYGVAGGDADSLSILVEGKGHYFGSAKATR